MKPDDITQLGSDILCAAKAFVGPRFVIAIAGPPGSGKSTLAARLQSEIERQSPASSPALLPMDGFHLDNAILESRALLACKGAPQTFDASGYLTALARIRDGREEVVVPSFDRKLDLARAGAIVIDAGDRIVLTEGNYLLVDTPPWDRTAALIDFSILIEVDFAILEKRLVDRWREHGLAPAAARERALGNDLPNARYVVERSRQADVVISGDES